MNEIFNSRADALAYFSTIEYGYAEFRDENGEVVRIVKNSNDASRLSLLFQSLASTEDGGIPTSYEEIQALIAQAEELGWG